MAYTANSTDFTSEKPGIFTRFGNWIAMVGQASYVARGMDARIAKLEQLQLKTDAELAKMGLRRDELPAYVFRDLMFV